MNLTKGFKVINRKFSINTDVTAADYQIIVDGSGSFTKQLDVVDYGQA